MLFKTCKMSGTLTRFQIHRLFEKKWSISCLPNEIQAYKESKGSPKFFFKITEKDMKLVHDKEKSAAEVAELLGRTVACIKLYRRVGKMTELEKVEYDEALRRKAHKSQKKMKKIPRTEKKVGLSNCI
mmetsp:Transcript_26481/g.37956  ORF Transcript_26481/g.37956 Transcript_26481/m.37956 type:complete len:128 (+) Transcript_26481:141-524(+)